MAGFWGRRRREEQERQDAADNDLARRARTALVTADERIRATGDEVAFAVAELGEGPTKDLREGLDAVKSHMSEAFHLHQLNHDEIPDTPEELRTRNARIVQLCEWAEDVLDERTEALQERVALVRQAPQILQRVRDDVERLRERLPQTRQAVQRLAGLYTAEALQGARINVDEADRLLDFALHSADVSERRRAARRSEEANLALETATEAVRRAASIADAVDDFEIEAIRAQSTLAEVIADSRGDLVAARSVPQFPAVKQAIAALESALSEVSSHGSKADPFADLARVSEANAALDAAVAKARERAARPLPSIEHVRHDIGAADRALGVAGSLINGHRGWIGADARTRFAEAQRLRIEIDPLVVSEDTREQAQQLARRTAQLANESVQLAQRDIDSSRPDNDDWGSWGGGGNRGGGGGGLLGPVLGGVLLGGLLGDMFD
jgi:exonuclease VII small subunit